MYGPPNRMKQDYAQKIRDIRAQLNPLLREMGTFGIYPDVYIRRDDPVTGKAPIVYIDVFKRGE